MYSAYLKIVFLSFVTFMTSAALAQEYDAFTDERDGNVYKTIKIGRETWLAENVKYIAEEITCHADIKHGASVKNYGCLYNFTDAQKVCPAGFHLPSKVEFSRLLAHVGEGQEGSENLRSSSWKGGNNSLGFSALPAGAFKADGFASFGSMAYFWTVSKCSKEGNNAAYSMTIGPAGVSTKSCNSLETDFLSVRCVKDTDEESNLNTFIDQRDGNKYKTVLIDKQIWMAENMRYITNEMDYKVSKKPREYGYLYKFKDAQKVCPNGWHLPTRAEFDRLLTEVCTGETGSDNLRHTKWAGGKDVSGFAALPAGKCEKTSCSFFDTEAFFWSSTERNKIIIYGLYINANKALVSSGKSDSYLAVRCLKDSVEQPEQVESNKVKKERQLATETQSEDSRIFTDPRDGKKYKTVRMVGGIWLAENLRYAGVKHLWPNGDKNNDASFGYLYTWENARKACPNGWRLPTMDDFKNLIESASDHGTSNERKSAGDNLRAVAFGGKDFYGFAALPAGESFIDWYSDYGTKAYFWSGIDGPRSHIGRYGGRANFMYIDDKGAFFGDGNQEQALSVRCLKPYGPTRQSR